MGHLHAHAAFARNRLHKESRRDVRCNSQLPRLEHNIVLPAPAGVLPLGAVQIEQQPFIRLRSYLQISLDETIAFRRRLDPPVA